MYQNNFVIEISQNDLSIFFYYILISIWPLIVNIQTYWMCLQLLFIWYFIVYIAYFGVATDIIILCMWHYLFCYL